MTLGPVEWNIVDAEANVPAMKPHLVRRVSQDVLRDTELGQIADIGGKLKFIPNYAGETPAHKPRARREPPYIPFQGEHAYLNPEPQDTPKRPTAEEIHALLSPVVPESLYGFTVGEKVLKAVGMHAGETVEIVGRGPSHLEENVRYRRDNGEEFNCHKDKLQKPAPAKPAWDPLTEPLQVGDVVELLYHSGDVDFRGLTGKVTNPCNRYGYIEVDGGMRCPAETRTAASTTWGDRSHVKLISRG